MRSFSKEPGKVFDDAAQKGYSRVRFQQGKPLLDRELNLLGDLSSPQRIAEPYIGSGVPTGSDGFGIFKLDFAAGNFGIAAGRCLVSGNEVVLLNNTTYRTQPRQQPAGPFPANKLNVYLRVFPTEITDAEDADLKNTGDVGFVTAIRVKTDWEVLVSALAINQPSHYLLATIDREGNRIIDLRRKDLTVAAVRDEINGARGNTAKLSDRLDASLAPAGGIKANAITNAQLADNSITSNKIVDGNVIATKLAANAVGNAQLADNSVTTNKIVDGNVIATKLAPNAVNEVNLVNNAVSKRTIQNGSVSMAKLGLTLVQDAQVSVPPSPAVGQPGEAVVSLQIADEHAFFLVSALQIAPRPLSPFRVDFVFNWMRRNAAIKLPGPGRPYIHQHQVVFQNFSAGAITVACKAFRIAEI